MRLTALRNGVQPENGIAQRHQERLLAGEVLAAQNGVAQAPLQALARVKEVGLQRLEVQFLAAGPACSPAVSARNSSGS